MSELVGQSLGQYRVEALIGQGGMARVYKAYQAGLDRHVAIKVIPAHLENGQEYTFLQRFTTEARLAARLSHQHIIPVHDFGEDAAWVYIVMEFVENGTLRDRLAHAAAHAALPNLAWVLLMGEQAARALDFAHARGIVHRDVKPGNMLLRTDDHLLLSDFGIATILEARRAATGADMAGAGGTIGTPQYMAPEQGTAGSVMDGRTDIYALGVVLFQCVTGRLPFNADTPMATVMQHVYAPPPRPSAIVPDLPLVVEQIILRALEKDPAHRYQRAGQMADDLLAARLALARGARAAVPTMPHRDVATGAWAPVGIFATPKMGEAGAPGTCFRCGAENKPSHKFCTSCGYDLSGGRAQVDRYLGAEGRPLRCRLDFHTGLLSGRAFTLHQDATTIGRMGGNDIVIPDGTVSRHHARLTFHDGAWAIEDAGSANGTWVNGQRVTTATRLRAGDEVRLGDEVLTFTLVG